MTEPLVRNAGFEDVELIAGLIRGFPGQLILRPLSDVVQNIDRFLVAELDGAVAGCVSWQILPSIGAPRDPSVEIKSLAVAEKAQRRGVGSALVRSAIQRIRMLHPVEVVALTFDPEFFARFGFVPVPKERLMHKLYAGCINCTRFDSPFTCPETAVSLHIRPGEPVAGR